MKFYEFFAGGGMVREGLGAGWKCLFANDWDPKKASCYRRRFPGEPQLMERDVASIKVSDLPGQADLAWASFPCQDLSLAGTRNGLAGKRSGTFWPFWRLMEQLAREGRSPGAIALENVSGAITSHGGRDLAAILGALAARGYSYAPMVINASLFLPQSRPRLFIIGFGPGLAPPKRIISQNPNPMWHPHSLALAQGRMGARELAGWLWLDPKAPAPREETLMDLLEEDANNMRWHTRQETRRLLSLMSPAHMEKVQEAMRSGQRWVGAVFKRTRKDKTGASVQRAEARFDGVAGCLRTPAGGSSRQIVLVVEEGQARSRLLSPRETARLMGLPDDYQLPERRQEAYHLTGDGVAAPVARWLVEECIEPALRHARGAGRASR
ncbi:MAG: DNA cytosine methyltransferase [Nitrospinota bacterium]|nr:DNA cytosine methyltransferase [Nitrospinota bacterium]MDH5755261.1 DNA cytosine methyltransferase [Nitrospinota bacterium]